MRTQDDAEAWLGQQIGQHLDYDQAYGQQCFDFFNYYYQFVTGRGPYGDGYQVEGAKDIWDIPTDLFDKIPDSNNLTPNVGDVLVYGPSWGGGYGHVEICRWSDANGCHVAGENEHNNSNEGVVEVYRSWASMRGLIGVMRPRFAAEPVPQPQPTPQETPHDPPIQVPVPPAPVPDDPVPTVPSEPPVGPPTTPVIVTPIPEPTPVEPGPAPIPVTPPRVVVPDPTYYTAVELIAAIFKKTVGGNMDISTVNKAIAAGIVTAVVGWAAHYGFTLSPVVHDALASLAFVLVTYVVGHIAVYLAPKNKEA